MKYTVSINIVKACESPLDNAPRRPLAVVDLAIDALNKEAADFLFELLVRELRAIAEAADPVKSADDYVADGDEVDDQEDRALDGASLSERDHDRG